MTTKIYIKNSSVAGKVPDAGALDAAELALNLKDQKLYSKDADGNVFEIGRSTAGEVPSGGTGDRPGSPNLGDIYYDTDLDILVYWNGSEWVEVGSGGSEVIVSPNPPAVDDLEEGTLWWNSDASDLSLYVLFNDADPDGGLKWIAASPNGGGGAVDGDDFVKLDDKGAKQTIKSGGLGISDGTDENITLGPDGTGYFEKEITAKNPLGGGANDSGVRLADTGSVNIKRDGSGSASGNAFSVEYGSEQTIRFSADGSSVFGVNGVANGRINLRPGSGLDTSFTVASGAIGGDIFTLQNDGSIYANTSGGAGSNPNYTLDGSNGNATFAGTVQAWSGYTSLGQGYTYFKSTSTGSSSVVDVLDSDDNVNVSLKADGSSTFAGRMKVGDFDNTTGIQIAENGSLALKHDYTGTVKVFQAFKGGTENISFDASGGATFSGALISGEFIQAGGISNGDPAINIGANSITTSTAGVGPAALTINTNTTIDHNGNATFAGKVLATPQDDLAIVGENNSATNSTLWGKNVGGGPLLTLNNAAGGTVFRVQNDGSTDVTNPDAGAFTFISHKPASTPFCLSGGTSSDASAPDWYIESTGRFYGTNITFAAGTPDEIDVRERLVKAKETFQELRTAVANATDFGELKAAMLVALEDYSAY